MARTYAQLVKSDQLRRRGIEVSPLPSPPVASPLAVVGELADGQSFTWDEGLGALVPASVATTTDANTFEQTQRFKFVPVVNSSDTGLGANLVEVDPGGATNALWQVRQTGVGRVFHFTMGDSDSAAAVSGSLIALGLDYGNANYPVGLLVANKAQTRGISIDQQATIQNPFAYGLFIQNRSAGANAAYPARFEQTSADHKPYIFVANAADSNDLMVEWYATTGQAGYVLSEAGTLVWKKQIAAQGGIALTTSSTITGITGTNNDTGSLISLTNAAGGRGIVLDSGSTASSATGYALFVQQHSTTATAIRFEQATAGAAKTVTFVATAANANDVLCEWTATAGQAGYVRADTGQLAWVKQVVLQGGLQGTGLHDFRASAVGNTPVAVRQASGGGQTADLLQVLSYDGATKHMQINRNGYVITRKIAAPADAELSASEATWWFDDTAGAAKIKFKAKDSGGTVRTGEVALT